MRDLPTTRDFGDFYNASKAASELRSYRNKGPIPSTRMLIDALKTEGVEGATVIDIGGGIGAVQHELLAAGAAHVTSVDASDAYIQTAREESERRGLSGRVTYHHGDFLELAETIPPADIVTLDRVINVYPDWKRLIHLSAARARRLYGLVYPRNTLPVKDGCECDEPARVARTRPRVCALAGRDRQADQGGGSRSVLLEHDRTLAGRGLSPPLITNAPVSSRRGEMGAPGGVLFAATARLRSSGVEEIAS